MTELKGENASCLLISLDNNRQNFEREIEPEIDSQMRLFFKGRDFDFEKRTLPVNKK